MVLVWRKPMRHRQKKLRVTATIGKTLWKISPRSLPKMRLSNRRISYRIVCSGYSKFWQFGKT